MCIRDSDWRGLRSVRLSERFVGLPDRYDQILAALGMWLEILNHRAMALMATSMAFLAALASLTFNGKNFVCTFKQLGNPRRPRRLEDLLPQSEASDVVRRYRSSPRSHRLQS